MSDSPKRYAQVGLGGRSEMYTQAITGRFAEHCRLVGLCDSNPGRMELAISRLPDGTPRPGAYGPDQFDHMIAETRPDVVVVTSMDVTHSDYIVRAMELGCDVITEKPMTTDELRAQKILDTVEKTGRSLRVTFNYRYSPPRAQLKEILDSGAIGEVLSVDFAWLLDTKHGADYFRRWHAKKVNSGSLLVHKATHHFDLVNWWLGDTPQEVFAHGALRYYRPERAKQFGIADRSERCTDCPAARQCPFFLDLDANEGHKAMYRDQEHHDGYFRDRCVFSDRIDIWDTMSVAVRYRRGALLSYQLHAYSPVEGYRVAFNGTKGRLEHVCCEATYVSGDGTVPGEMLPGSTSTTLIPEFSAAQSVPIRTGKGGHGGGDSLLLADLLSPEVGPDPLGLRAGHWDGAYSILVGVAAYHSIDSGQAVRIDDLLAGRSPDSAGKKP